MKRIWLLMLLSGCGAAASGEDEEAIQGGAVDKKDPAVGLVWIKGGGFCSGSLVAPNVVLTAGHCVESKVAGFYTGEGDGASDVGTLPVGGFVGHRVVEQAAHPSYRSENVCPNPTFDVALLKLAKPIKTIAPLAVATHAPTAGTVCRAVGYGVHDDNSGNVTVEQRRVATETVQSIHPTSIRVDRKSGLVDHGDSGGPLLCKGRIAGTTSCGNSEFPDARDAYYGRVDSIADWIDQTIASWK